METWYVIALGVWMALWNSDVEIRFFEEAQKDGASPEQVFYKVNGAYFAYVPKRVEDKGATLQSRNALIGKYTEEWWKDL